MLGYFVVATIVALVLMGLVIVEAYREEVALGLLFVILVWLVIVVLPSNVVTTRTIVERAQPSEYKILKVSPYCSVLTTGLETDQPDSYKINDSYILHKIEIKQFKVIKHIHLNIWGDVTDKTTYFIKGITKTK
jgi:hypothetical protein